MCFSTSEQASQILGEQEAQRDFEQSLAEHVARGKLAVSTATNLLELLQPGDSIRFQSVERNLALIVIASLDLVGTYAVIRLGYEHVPSTYVSIEEAANLIADFLE